MVATTEQLTIGEGMLQVLRGYGVEYVFSSPGSEWPPLWDALARAEAEGAAPRYINARHEMVAAGVAMGYHRATGRLPALLLHTGVGVAHCAMELRAARSERTPMAVFAGESKAFGEWPGRDPGAQFYRFLADVNGPAEMAAPVVKRASTLGSTHALMGTVADVCRLAMTPPLGPVFLGVPMELILGSEQVSLPRHLAPPPAPTRPTDADLDELAALLVGAERPVILTETAGRDPADLPKVVALAEALGIPVCEAMSPVFLNFPRSHPLHQGYDPKELLADADVILLLACQGAWYPASARPERARIVALNPDPAQELQPYWALGVDQSLAGAIGPSLDGLLAAVRDRMRANDGRPAERLAKWRERHQKERADWASVARAQAERTPIDPRWATYVLGQTIPEDAIVAEELTSERPFLLRNLPRDVAGTFQGRNHGGLGTSVSVAQGLKFALRDRLVVNVLGDGAFNYNSVFAAFGFAKQWDTPVLHVLFNNEGYAAMKSAHQRYFPEGWAVRTNIYPGTEIAPPPDYVAFAKSFGAHAERVSDPRALEAAITNGVARARDDQQVLIEVATMPGDVRR